MIIREAERTAPGRDVGVPYAVRGRIAVAGAWVTAGFVLDKVLGAGQMVVVARLLTPVDFGLMAATAVVLVGFLTVTEMGIESALVSRERPSETDLAVAWTLSIGRALMLATVLWASAGLIADFYRSPELMTIIRVYVMALIIQAAQSPAMALLLRNLELGRRVRLDLMRRLIDLTATVGLAFLLRNVWALVLGQLIAFTVTAALSYRVAPFRPRLSLERGTLRYFRRYGGQVSVTAICIFLVTSGGEVVVGRLLGVGVLGVYQIAMVIPTLLGIRALVVMHQVAFPTYVALRDDLEGLGRAFRVQVSVVVVWLVPLTGGVALLAPDLVPLLFGERWVTAVRPLQILTLYAFCAGLCGVMASLHYGVNRPDFQRRIWLAQAALYVIAIWPAARLSGLIGVCAVLTAAYCLGLALHVWFTWRVLGRLAWGAAADVLRVGAVVGVLLLVAALVTQWRAEWRAVELVVPMVALVGSYGVYVWRVEVPHLRALWVGAPHVAR